MNEYTPSTMSVRAAYQVAGVVDTPNEFRERWIRRDLTHGVEFDRWLTAHDAEVFEAGRREGAETALKYAADNIVFSDEWRNHGNNDPRLDGEAEASAWLEVEASRPLPTETKAPGTF